VAAPRHKREPDARARLSLPGSRVLRTAACVAVVATIPVVGAGLLSTDDGGPATLAAGHHRPSASLPEVARAPESARAPEVSRSFDRAVPMSLGQTRATARAVAGAHVQQWSTTDLNLWSSASSGAIQVGEIPTGEHVLVTGRTADGRVEVVVDGRSRWVTAGYLSHTHPTAAPTVTPAAGLSMAPCPDSSVEYRLTPAAVYVYRSVCHAFPQITSYGGWAPRGEHADGKAIDIMTTDLTLGNAIAAFLQQHAAELHLYDIIWQQHIWTPVRASEGWRLMPDRGSPTANHMNHVHVSVY
jgi:hypothetical protein